MRWLLAAAVLLGGCGDPRDCSIDAVEYDFAGSGVLDNCGELYSDSYSTAGMDTSGYEVAQSCVIDHVQQQRPFFVSWRRQGVDTYQGGAYIGTVHDGTWALAAFQQEGGVFGSQPAERDSCTDLTAGSSCNSWEFDLCIECVGRKAADKCEP
jgi:hypothetical protein